MSDDDRREAAVAADFARYRRLAREVFTASPVDAVFAGARTRAARRRTATALAAATAVVAVLATGTVVVRAAAAPDPAPPAPPVSSPATRPAPAPLAGIPMAEPTGLLLLLPGRWLNVDAGTDRRISVTGWIPRPGSDPLLADWDWAGEHLAPIEVTSGQAADVPGTPPVVHLNRDAYGTVAAAADRIGIGLWVLEEERPGRCTLRVVDVTGRPLRTPREMACDTRLVGDTAHGLWVVEQALAGDAVLLDGLTRDEVARFGAVAVIDDHRVLTTDDDWRTMELRDLGTGDVTPLDAPPAYGWRQPRVGPVSPDGRWLPLTFGMPSSMPQAMDVWLLDLRTAQWRHLPGMPTHAALKATNLAWAGDGRLVLLGRFPDDGLLVTWRPGDPELALLPYERPPSPPDEPYTNDFLVR